MARFRPVRWRGRISFCDFLRDFRMAGAAGQAQAASLTPTNFGHSAVRASCPDKEVHKDKEGYPDQHQNIETDDTF